MTDLEKLIKQAEAVGKLKVLGELQDLINKIKKEIE